MIVDSLWHFPVKGLTGACRDTVHLEAGKHFPDDRLYAIGNGHPKHDELTPGLWQKKALFLQQMKIEALAALDCRFDGTCLDIHHHGKLVVSADMDSADGRHDIDAFFAEFVGDQTPGAPRLMRIAEGSFADTPYGEHALLTLGGTASVARFAEATDTTPDMRRFRLNIMLQTDTPFEEASLIGKRVKLGAAVVKVVDPVGRCAAIDVDPETALRGPHYLPMMEKAFGHTDLGIFAEVAESGPVSIGDRLEQLD